MVKYSYDAWGKPLTKTDTLATTLGTLNPFRYRGYVYDEETGLYYLRSRYYNPTWGRFVNADSVLGKPGQLFGHNVFTYCWNNPVSMSDASGHIPNFSTMVTDSGYDLLTSSSVGLDSVMHPDAWQNNYETENKDSYFEMLGKQAVQDGFLKVEVVNGQYEMLHQGVTFVKNKAIAVWNSPTIVWFRDLYSSKLGRIVHTSFGTISNLWSGMTWSATTIALCTFPEPVLTKGLGELTALKASYHLANYLKNFNELIILLSEGDRQ